MLTPALLSALALSAPALATDVTISRAKVKTWRHGVTARVAIADDTCDGKVGTGTTPGSLRTCGPGKAAYVQAENLRKSSRSIVPTDGGPDLVDADDVDILHQRGFFQTPPFAPSPRAVDRELTVVVPGATRGVGLVLDAASWEDGSWDVTTDDTYTYAARRVDNGDGTAFIEVKVQGLARDADLTGLESATVSSNASLDTAGTARIAMGLARTRATARVRFRTATDGASADGFAYAYGFTYTHPEDDESEFSISAQATVGSTPGAAGVVRSRLRQKKNGDLKHVAWTIDADPGAAHALEVAIYDEVTGEDLLIVDGDTPSFSARYFEAAALDFDGDPTGTPFSLTLSARGADGGTLGTHRVDIPSLAATQDIDLSGWDAIDAGALGIAIDGTTATVTVSSTGGETGAIQALELTFDEPFEGPAPQENPLQVDFSADVHTRVQTAALTDTQATGDLGVDVAFYDGNDDIIEAVGWTGVIGDNQTGPNVSGTSLNVVKAVKSATGLGLKEAR